ncbi:MAG: hypothetical protein ACSHYA_05330 [Opitutaceae bacterium]
MLLLSARAELSNLKVWLEPTACLPGDVVELHAELSSEAFAEFELKVPKNESLHFVNQHSLPTDYDGARYVQKTIWTLQSVTSGTVELKDIVAIIHKDGTINEHTLATQTLKVGAYDSIEDANTPLPLPAATARGEDAKHSLALFVLAAITIAGVIYFLARKQTNKADDHIPQATQPSLEDLEQALKTGEIPTGMIESILCNATIQLSDDARRLFEQAAYHTSKKTSTSDLMTVLEKERGS